MIPVSKFSEENYLILNRNKKAVKELEKHKN